MEVEHVVMVTLGMYALHVCGMYPSGTEMVQHIINFKHTLCTFACLNIFNMHC